MQLETTIKALETWRTTIAIDADKAQPSHHRRSTARIAELEARPTGGTTDRPPSPLG